MCKLLLPHKILVADMKSLSLLYQISMELFGMKQGRFQDVGKLATLQVQRQEAYIAAYGVDKCRPKHHVRFHLPEQLAKWKLYVDCLPMERKHKTFKSYVANGRFDTFTRGDRNSKGQFSHLTVQRIFYYHCRSVANAPLGIGLVGKCKIHPDRSMRHGAPVHTSDAAVINGRRLAVGDVVLGRAPGEVCELWSSQQFPLKVVLRKLLLKTHALGHSVWKRTNTVNEVDHVDESPHFWCFEDDECTCLI